MTSEPTQMGLHNKTRAHTAKCHLGHVWWVAIYNQDSLNTVRTGMLMWWPYRAGEGVCVFVSIFLCVSSTELLSVNTDTWKVCAYYSLSLSLCALLAWGQWPLCPVYGRLSCTFHSHCMNMHGLLACETRQYIHRLLRAILKCYIKRKKFWEKYTCPQHFWENTYFSTEKYLHFSLRNSSVWGDFDLFQPDTFSRPSAQFIWTKFDPIDVYEFKWANLHRHCKIILERNKTEKKVTLTLQSLNSEDLCCKEKINKYSLLYFLIHFHST